VYNTFITAALHESFTSCSTARHNMTHIHCNQCNYECKLLMQPDIGASSQSMTASGTADDTQHKVTCVTLVSARLDHFLTKCQAQQAFEQTCNLQQWYQTVLDPSQCRLRWYKACTMLIMLLIYTAQKFTEDFPTKTQICTQTHTASTSTTWAHHCNPGETVLADTNATA